MTDLNYGSTDPQDSDYDPELCDIASKYPPGSIGRDAAIFQYALRRAKTTETAMIDLRHMGDCST